MDSSTPEVRGVRVVLPTGVAGVSVRQGLRRGVRDGLAARAEKAGGRGGRAFSTPPPPAPAPAVRGRRLAGFWNVGIGGVLPSSGRKADVEPSLAGVIVVESVAIESVRLFLLLLLVESRRGVAGTIVLLDSDLDLDLKRWVKLPLVVRALLLLAVVNILFCIM